jgi:hypothetical protein
MALFLLMVIVLILPSDNQPPVLAVSTHLFHPGIGTATIDGLIGVEEWSNADSYTILMEHSVAPDLYGTLYVMQSETDLYFAFNVNDDELTTGYLYGLYGDTLEFSFDDNNSGSLFEIDENHVLIYAADPWYEDGHFSNVTGSSDPDTNQPGGTTDGEGAVGRHDFYNQYELRFPLCSGDDFDFCLSPGDILGLDLNYLDVFPVTSGFDLESYGYPKTGSLDLVTIELIDPDFHLYLPLIMK